MNRVAMPAGSFRLPVYARPVGSVVNGEGGHRSGWPYVAAFLREHQSPEGMLVEDFVERTFNPARRAPTLRERVLPTPTTPPTWREPWVGIFHYPPNLPEWLAPSSHPSRVFAEKRFRKSAPHLKGAIALSDYLAEWLRGELSVPVTVIKHPTEFPEARFRWEAFVANQEKKLVQVGWFLRNYRAIYQVGVPPGFTKVHLTQDKPHVLQAQERTDKHTALSKRPDVGETRVVSWLENDEYDRLFTENIIFMELLDASANNAVIESIVRETPLVVNRHPAVVEYLGAEYPLFYDDLHEVEHLLTMPLIEEAHRYLRAMDKEDLRVEHFAERLDQFIRTVS